MDQNICEVAACGNSVAGDSVFDKYFKKCICVPCYRQNFKFAEDNGIGDWFEKNFADNKTAYPPEFWRKVGAFVDLSKTDQRAYK